MNEKKSIIVLALIIIFAFICGYFIGTLRQTRYTDNQFRIELEERTNRIKQLEREIEYTNVQLGRARIIIEQTTRNISTTADRMGGYISSAIQQTGDIRETINQLRETATVMENSYRELRNIVSGLFDYEINYP